MGNNYLDTLITTSPAPTKIIRYGDNGATECLSAWILEPGLTSPGEVLAGLLPEVNGSRTLKGLQDALIARKKDRELREELVWEALGSEECCKRACEFFHDLAAIAFAGETMNSAWHTEVKSNGTPVFTATHIRRACL